MRFVLCDDDALFASLIDSVVAAQGHEIVGVADRPSVAVQLLGATRPDVFVVDPAIGIGTDFDMIQTAIDLGVRTLVFSRSAELLEAAGYHPRPQFVAKPDVVALEEAIAALGDQPTPLGEEVPVERRRKPTRAAAGPVPTGPTDAAAFYDALNHATEGDGLVRVVPVEGRFGLDLDTLAEGTVALVRATDRVLVSTTAVVALLVGGGEAGTKSIIERLTADVIPPRDAVATRVVIQAGESPDDAFERLKRS